jgi:hypothetical protein
MDHIGIDVHKKESQICTLTEGGELIEQRIRTEPERFAAVLGERPRARIVIEASTESAWVGRCLEGRPRGTPQMSRSSPRPAGRAARRSRAHVIAMKATPARASIAANRATSSFSLTARRSCSTQSLRP